MRYPIRWKDTATPLSFVLGAKMSGTLTSRCKECGIPDEGTGRHASPLHCPGALDGPCPEPKTHHKYDPSLPGVAFDLIEEDDIPF
jgi:hypothetical protein